jgi:ribosomal protein S18 acetylase RimI-like enzyme
VRIEEKRLSVRRAEFGGRDDAAVGRLVGAYLTETEIEIEKAFHLGTGASDQLPQRYRVEVEDPEHAYEHATVYVAELDDSPVGVVVVQENAGTREVKRVWADPGARGQRVGSALLDTALGADDLPVRLTVWDWRDDAIRLYRKRGFVSVPSWEDRPRLICMERPASSRNEDR